VNKLALGKVGTFTSGRVAGTTVTAPEGSEGKVAEPVFGMV